MKVAASRCGAAPGARHPARRRRAARQRGSSVVEFALVAPLLFTLLLGTIEVGRALYVQQAVVHAAREGARLAVVTGGQSGPVRARVRQVLAPLRAAVIRVQGPDAQRMVKVTVVVRLRVMAGSLLGAFRGTIPLRGESAMRFEN